MWKQKITTTSAGPFSIIIVNLTKMGTGQVERTIHPIRARVQCNNFSMNKDFIAYGRLRKVTSQKIEIGEVEISRKLMIELIPCVVQMSHLGIITLRLTIMGSQVC